MNVLLAGAGLAAVMGLLTGTALRPDLAGDDRPEGPQILTATGGARSTGPFDDEATTVTAAYHGAPPDYLIGTDWKKSLMPATVPAG